MMTCPGCGCREFALLGTLAALTWFRCRLCGSTVNRPRAAHPWLRRQIPSLSPQVRRAFGHYRVPLTELSEPLRDALDRYVAGLARRSGTTWTIERLTRPPGRHRAVLVSPRGLRVHLFYIPGRWRSDHTAHVIPKQPTHPQGRTR